MSAPNQTLCPNHLEIHIKVKISHNIFSQKPFIYVQTSDHLVDLKFCLQIFCFIGLIEVIGAHVQFFYYMRVYAGLQSSDLLLAFNQFGDGFKGRSRKHLFLIFIS